MALCAITPIEFRNDDVEKHVTFMLPHDSILLVELSYLQFDLVMDGDYEGCFLKHARDLIRSYSLRDVTGTIPIYYCPATTAEMICPLSDGPTIDSSEHLRVRIPLKDLMLFHGTKCIPQHDYVFEFKVNLRDEFYKQNYTTGALSPGITTTKIKYSVKAPTLVIGLTNDVPPEELKYEIPVQRLKRIFVTPDENGCVELTYWTCNISSVVIKSENTILDVWHQPKELDVIVNKHHQTIFFAEPPVDEIKFRIHVAKSPHKLPVVFEIFNDTVINLRKEKKESSHSDFADDEDSLAEEHEFNVLNELKRRLGPAIEDPCELLSLATVLAYRANIKLDREAKRKNSVLIKWLEDNWTTIKPYLDEEYPDLEDDESFEEDPEEEYFEPEEDFDDDFVEEDDYVEEEESEDSFEEPEPKKKAKKKVQPLLDKESAEQALKIFNEVEKNLKTISKVLGKYIKG